MTSHEDLLSIAVVGGTDRETQAIVERELDAAGIEHFLEGSVVYNVQVHPQDRERASVVLKSSEDLKGRWIQFADEA